MSQSSNHAPRHRGRGQPRILSGTLKTIATTAVVTYGAYKAYEFFFQEDDRRRHDESLIPQWLSSLWLDTEENVNRSTGRQMPRKTKERKPLDPRTRHRLSQQGIRKCRQETVKAYATCWPELQQVIEDSTNTIPLTQELRSLRQSPDKNTQERQGELWQEIQSATLTRFVATQYASSLLVLSLTLQLHWIGGKVFRYQQEQDLSMARGTAQMAQHVMMQSHEYMKTQGLPLLIAAVRRAIAASPMEEWKPTTFVTLSELERALERVDAHLEKGRGKTPFSRNWIRIILPDPSSLVDDDESDVEEQSTNPCTVAFMLEAFWDLAESPAWQDAKLQAIQATKNYLRDLGWGPVFCQSNTLGVDADIDKESKVDPPVPIQHVPLAKLMAPLKTLCSIVADRGSRKDRRTMSLLAKLQKLPTVLELGEVSFQQ